MHARSRASQPTAKRLRLALALTAIALVLSPAQALAGRPAARSAQSPAEPLPVTISLNPLLPGRPVPAGFLGLSFEAAALNQLGGYAKRGDLVRMLRSLGPGVIRFGGITADENVGWTDAQTPPPAWASSTIDPASMQALGELARRSGWRVLLTVGLAHYEPQAAAREVAAAHHALGRYLEAVEIGNEPDSFARHGYRPEPWLPQVYEEQVSEYREAIGALTPNVPIAGPDSSGSGAFLEWGFAEGLAQAPALLTGHHYPLGCAQTPPPSIESLLSSETRGREARSLETYMSIANAQRIPLRIDEAGSVSCGGVSGISDTFASALWASGYIAQTMAFGAVGINLQGNPNNCNGYTPICAADTLDASSGNLYAEPDFYALLMTRSLIGYRPLPTTIASAGSPDLVATGFENAAHTFKLLLSDDEPAGAQPLVLSIPVGAGYRSASLLTLRGPAQGATSGITLGGRAVPASGVWSEPSRLPVAEDDHGVIELTLAPSTATLLTVVKAPPRRRHAKHRH